MPIHLNGVYTQRFNRKHSRVGLVFQGCFKAILIEKGGYLLELACYIDLNLVRAGLVESADQWVVAAIERPLGQQVFQTGLIGIGIICFSKNARIALESYMQFVESGVQQPAAWSRLGTSLEFTQYGEGGQRDECPVFHRLIVEFSNTWI